MNKTQHVTINLGAKGGTVYVGSRDGNRFTVTEVARFDNRPVERDAATSGTSTASSRRSATACT